MRLNWSTSESLMTISYTLCRNFHYLPLCLSNQLQWVTDASSTNGFGKAVKISTVQGVSRRSLSSKQTARHVAQLLDLFGIKALNMSQTVAS